MRRLIVPALAAAALPLGLGGGARAGETVDGRAPQPSVWITTEQEAQRLLDSGHAAQAARLFTDPRRRAYADMRIGRDEEAARLLAPLTDPDSEYNRGNALARSGQLVPALAAYDAALEQAPEDRDIRHNRDLVASVLASRAQGQPGQSGAPQQGASGQQGEPAQSNGGRANGQSSPQAQSGRSDGSQTGRSPSAGSATPQQEAEQAKEDAALAAALRRRGESAGQSAGKQRTAASAPKGSASGADSRGTGRAGGAETDELVWPPPKSEQALALEQWLRRIPEDPGGLLRRKFLIEHMERQEGSEP